MVKKINMPKPRPSRVSKLAKGQKHKTPTRDLGLPSTQTLINLEKQFPNIIVRPRSAGGRSPSRRAYNARRVGQ